MRHSKTGTVRISGGKFRGRTIATPGGATHPMGERERLALFNMIGNDLTGVDVLDAYAGSGALGVEAMSRGAKSATFVDKSARAAGCIRGNLRELGCDDATEVTKMAMSDAVAELGGVGRRFGLILADPPYDDFRVSEVNALGEILADNGVLVLSHPGDAPELTGLTLEKTRQYAGARLSIYRKALVL